jgi:hypothetical protein
VEEEVLADEGQQVPAQQGRQQQPLRQGQGGWRLLQLVLLRLLLACLRCWQAGEAPEAARQVAAVLLQRGGGLDADWRVAVHRILEGPGAVEQCESRRGPAPLAAQPRPPAAIPALDAQPLRGTAPSPSQPPPTNLEPKLRQQRSPEERLAAGK